MAISTEPTVLLESLPRADGSATYSQNGFSVIASVNGPIEVTRRDELPEAAAVEIIVRPANGPGGTRERHLESILHAALRQIILVHNFPRTLIQITLQIIGTPQSGSIGTKLLQPDSNLPALPALLQTAILALLSGSIPLSMTISSALLAYNESKPVPRIVQHPSADEIQQASSVHVLAFTSTGELLVAESEGVFSYSEWDDIFRKAKTICGIETSNQGSDVDIEDEDEGSVNMQSFVRSALETKIEADLHWKS